MYCRVLACDFDGTGAVGEHLAPEVADALARARADGIVTLLVTGRVLEDLVLAGVDLQHFDAVVAENGAVVFLPALGRTIVIGAPPPEKILAALREAGIPFHAGVVVVGTQDTHAAQVLALVRRFALDSQLVFNRAALMLLPSGVNKMTGAVRALQELGRSEHNMVAFGDAENDLPLWAGSELGVAARGAAPEIAARADECLSHPNGEGIALFVQRLLAGGAVLPTPPRHEIVLGATDDGVPVTLPASGINCLISGDPRSGKSWLGGLVAERLLERGYRLCIVDPEGDHLTLGRRPSTLALGGRLPLPEPEAVPELLRDKPLSVCLSLASLTQAGKLAYVDRLLCALDAGRRVTGIPHWTLIDEAHYFFHRDAPCTRRFESRSGHFLFVTYRPSMVAAEVYDAVGAHLVTRTAVEEERYFMTSLLQARAPADLVIADALGALDVRRAGLLRLDAGAPRWQAFIPEARITPHVHHRRKYLDERVPRERGFRFVSTTPPRVAQNVVEFCSAVAEVPLESLGHHLQSGDFSRWAADVLGDAPLAAGLRKLEETTRAGAAPSRTEILQHVRDRYAL